MTTIITPHIWCPLCEREMKEQKMMYGQFRTTAFICKPCNIFTFPFDPAFNKWRDSDKNIPCPHCQYAKVKWFARYLDNYMKFQCPKCGIIGEGDCNTEIAQDGSMDLELMDGSEQIPEETRIEIPIDRLNLPQDTKAKLKKQIREKRNETKES